MQNAPDLLLSASQGLFVLVGDTGIELLREGPTTYPSPPSTLVLNSQVRGHIGTGQRWTRLDRF